MRISRVRINAFKGVDVELPWASAVVLFGPNDAGKTNILEGFLSNFGEDRSVRVEPYTEGRFGSGDQALVAVAIELNGLDIDGHPDQEAFLRWLLADNNEPWWKPDVGILEAEEIRLDEDRALAGLRDDFGRLRASGEPHRDLSALVARVRQACGPFRERRLALRGMPPPSPDEILSPHFTVWNGMLYWHARQGGEQIELAEFALGQAEPGRTTIEEFTEVLDLGIVRIAASGPAHDALLDRVEKWVEAFSLAARDRAAGSRDGHIVHLLAPNDLWVERTGESTVLRPAVRDACTELSGLVQKLLPPFVSGSYEVRVVPLFPDEWHAYGGRHVAIRLRPHGAGEDFDLELASSGVASWTGFALLEALRVETRATHASQRNDGSQTVYVFDEPEAHLHPLAQEQAAAWIAERVRDGATVLLASHAVPFLRLPLEDVEYLKVSRNADWETVVQPMTEDVLGTVAESAEALGLSPAALVQVTRAWLVVEGEHDKMILTAFHGAELSRAGVRMLALRGAGRAKASFLNLEVLAPLGLPFFCLLDNVRAEAIRTGRLDRSDRSEEEKIAEQLWRLSREEGVELDVLGLPYPDVLCALPITAVAKVARANAGRPAAATSWDELIEDHVRYRAQTRAKGESALDFKAFVLSALGLDGWPAGRLVAEALETCRRQTPAGDPLSRMVAHVLAAAASPPVPPR